MQPVDLDSLSVHSSVRVILKCSLWLDVPAGVGAPPLDTQHLESQENTFSSVGLVGKHHTSCLRQNRDLNDGDATQPVLMCPGSPG